MEDSSLRRDLERDRASFAWQQVKGVAEGLRKDYRSVVNKFPTQIVNNGLGPSLAFLLAKSGGKQEGAHWNLYAQLQEWLCTRQNVCQAAASSKNQLIDWLTAPETKSSHYRRATEEALSLAEWLKRFAEALAP